MTEQNEDRRAHLLGRAGRRAGADPRGGRGRAATPTPGTPSRRRWPRGLGVPGWPSRPSPRRPPPRGGAEPAPALERAPAAPPEDPTPGRTCRRGRPRAGGAEPELELLAPEELRRRARGAAVRDGRPGRRGDAGRRRCAARSTQVRAGWPTLAADYDERRAGITLRQVGEGWRLYTREEHAAVVERLPRRRAAQPAHPGGAGDPRRHRLPAAGDPRPGLGHPRRRGGRRHADAALARAGARGRHRPRQRRRAVRDDAAVPGAAGAASLADLPELAPLLPDPRSVLAEGPDA